MSVLTPDEDAASADPGEADAGGDVLGGSDRGRAPLAGLHVVTCQVSVAGPYRACFVVGVWWTQVLTSVVTEGEATLRGEATSSSTLIPCSRTPTPNTGQIFTPTQGRGAADKS